MIACHITHLLAHCAERGYTLDEVRACIVSEDGEQITVDVDHPAYPRTPKSELVQAKIQISGPGTELKKLLKKIGITASPTCSCNARAKTMDTNGIEWCENNIPTIVGWLKEEASKRKLPFIETAAKLLVKRAIKNAKAASVN